MGRAEMEAALERHFGKVGGGVSMGKRLFPVYVIEGASGVHYARAATVRPCSGAGMTEGDAIRDVAEGIRDALAEGVQPEPAKPMDEGWSLRWVQVEEPQADPPHGPFGWTEDEPQGGMAVAPDAAVVSVLAERLAAIEAKVEALASAGATAFPHLEAAMRGADRQLTLMVGPLEDGEWRATVVENQSGGVWKLGGAALRRYGQTATQAIANLERVAQEGKAT